MWTPHVQLQWVVTLALLGDLMQAELEALEDSEHLQQQERSPAARQKGISLKRRTDGSSNAQKGRSQTVAV